MQCDRCDKETISVTGSWFNTETICDECDDAERAHSQFAEAHRIENEAVKRGDYNHPGIGLPDELRRKQ